MNWLLAIQRAISYSYDEGAAMQLSFDLGLLVGDGELDLSLVLDTDSGSWSIGTPPYASGDLQEHPPERFVFEHGEYRVAVATGFFVIPRKTLGEAGGLSGLLGGAPVPETDSLVMPGIRLPVIHLFMEVPATSTRAIGRLVFLGTRDGDERMAMVTPRDQFDQKSSMDPEMGVSEFFDWCEEEFFLPPVE